jgi:hypothetical protein
LQAKDYSATVYRIILGVLIFFYAPCATMGSWAIQADSVVSVPEFYWLQPVQSVDTTFEMKCYDRQNKLLEQWTMFDQVRYVSVFKTYTDSKHTYKDRDGHVLPLPVSSIITRYDRIGTQQWLRVNYANQQYTKLTEHRDNIVKTDTLKTAEGRVVIYRYYSVAP